MSLIIKKMETDEEIRGKAYVHWQAWQETYPGMMPQAVLDARTLERCLEQSYRWPDNLLVAKDGEKVIGFAGYGESREIPDCGEIFALYLLAEYQGKGIGSRLLKAALEQLAEYPKICLWVLKENRKAIRFYEKHDFQPDGMEKFSEPVSAVGIRMVRKTAIALRPYRDEDYEALCDFLIELNKEDRSHINWNWARLEWMIEHPEFDKSLKGSIGLWRDGGRIVGAAVYDMYFGEAFCGALPEYGDLYPKILDYAWRELRDENGLGIAVCDENGAEINALKAAGFVPANQTETVMTAALDRPFDAPLPEGYSLKEVDPVRDTEALQWLFWQGFDHGEDREEFEKEEKTVSGIRPHFRSDLSLAAVGPDGELAALAGLWFREGTDYAYVEPVCTVPAHRGRGLAKALLYEAMKRARALGAKKAYVISEMDFYGKLGFRKEYHYRFYWRTESDA